MQRTRIARGFWKRTGSTCLFLLLVLGIAASDLFLFAEALAAQQLSYDVVYVRQPRYGDQENTRWPEVFNPTLMEPGADLVLLRPNGQEEVLVSGNNGAVTDPYVSFDGKWVYFSYVPDARRESRSATGIPFSGANIFRVHVNTRALEQLTYGAFTPSTAAGDWDLSNPADPAPGLNGLGYGVLNLGPCPLPNGRVMFTSNRNGFVPTKNFSRPALQLFVMDEDGQNVEMVGPMNLGSALHPTVLRDGRVIFSSYESQGLRDDRQWGVWYIYPDGREWGPVVSGFKQTRAFHFMTQLSGGDIVVEDYYNLHNNGFGTLYRLPSNQPSSLAPFHSAFLEENPALVYSTDRTSRMSFTPKDMTVVTPFTHGADRAAPLGGNGGHVGKFTQPSGAPDANLLVVWSPGPAHDGNTPYYDSGLYLIPGGDTIWDPNELVLIKNDPSYNESWPRAVVPYSAIYGVEEPAPIEWLPNNGGAHPELPAGSAFGLVGTSSLYKRESFPGKGASNYSGLDKFNTTQNGHSSNWSWQGADAGLYDNSAIWAIRLLAMEPTSDRKKGPHAGQHFFNHANERLRIMGEIPVRKTDASGNEILDPEGNPDTSFLTKIPADTPYTFQTIDRNGMVLNMSQTWHQVRPGEIRSNCGGCHAHSQTPLAFEQTAAASGNYDVSDLSTITPLVTRTAAGEPGLELVQAGVVDVEFYRDIRPILQRSCVSCHTSSNPNPHGKLVLDDYSLYDRDLPGDYKRLADDTDAEWGHPPIIRRGKWRQTNASRYIRKFQSRRSLLIWKLFGERLDGWLNSDHPTETVPGVVESLPVGASANDADLDYTGEMMPPPDSGVPPLSEAEKLMFARWIDLGAPIDTATTTGAEGLGWFLDETRPTLTISSPSRDGQSDSYHDIRVGISDANSGIAPGTLSIKVNVPVAGRPPFTELVDLAFEQSAGVYVIQLSEPLPTLARLMVEVADGAGNITQIQRALGPVKVFSSGFESGGLSDWSGTGSTDF